MTPKQTKKAASTHHQVVDHSPLFTRTNYLLMLAGAVTIGIGMLIMSGGKSADPKVFNYDEVYSTMRITVAPVLIILGLGLEVYAIFKKSAQ
jgi:hypothetical protein